MRPGMRDSPPDWLGAGMTGGGSVPTDRGRGRVVGPLLAAILVLGVIGLAVIPRLTGSKHSAGGSGTPLTKVRVLAGSETAPYLTSAAVTAQLRAFGYQLAVDTAGSRQIVDRNLKDYDIAFPSNATQAEQIQQKYHLTRPLYAPFSTPLAIATFSGIEKSLIAAGVVHEDGQTALFDMHAYLDLVAEKKRWPDLPPNPDNPLSQTNRSVYITSTDIQTSNSADLYLALASYVKNGDNVVADEQTATTVAGQLARLFQVQGFQGSSTEEPFDDYLTLGISKTPMVMIYESQFRAAQIAKNGSITPDRVLMYPTPTIYAKHTVVPFSAPGDAVGRLLTTDPALQDVAAQYGFRTADLARQTSSSNHAGLPPPPQLADVVEPPTQNITEKMIKTISELPAQGAGG